MRSTFIEREEGDYPKLQINHKSTLIVLFIQYGLGFVVSSTHEDYPLGSDNMNWSESQFTDYKGVVTLES